MPLILLTYCAFIVLFPCNISMLGGFWGRGASSKSHIWWSGVARRKARNYTRPTYDPGVWRSAPDARSFIAIAVNTRHQASAA